MTTDRDSENKSSDLRRLAESVLAEKRRDAVDTSALSPEEVEKVFHDLQVHQIELEMQNEELRQSQIQLEELKDRYLDLYDFAPMGYITLNHKGLVVEANLTVCRLLGVDRRSLINRPFQRFVCRDDQDNYYLFERELFETKAPKTCEVQLVKKDSEPIHAQLNTSVRRYSEEATECYRISIVDLAERKQAESSLRESHERYRSVFENAPVGIFHSTRDGKFIDVNPQLALILGYDSQSELIAHVNQTSIAQALYVDPERRAALVDKVTEGEGRWLEVENLYRRKNGEIIVGRLYFRNLPARGDRLEGFVEDFTERKKAEEELLEARQEWRDIFQAIGHPTIIMDVEHGIVSANKAAIEVSGKSIKELLGTKCYEIFHANNAPPHCCPMESLLESGSLETVEMEMEALGGYYLVSCTPVLDAEGRMQKIIHIGNDITQRKKAEEALRQEKEKAEKYLDVAGVIIVALDREGRVSLVNKKGYKILGYESHEIMGKHWFDTYVPESDRARTKAVFLQIMAGEIEAVRYFENPVLIRSGEERLIAWYNTLLTDEDGKIIGTLSSGEDITERKKAGVALRESEERYRSLFEESIAPILVTDVDGTIVDANRACEDLFGYTTEELLGSNVQALYADPADGFRFGHDMERVGFVRDYPQTYRRKDGTQIECITQASVRKSEDGKALGYRGTLRDVTHEKALQRQLLEAQKMEAFGTLAGGIAHDFNNLLQVIQGYADMALLDIQKGQPGHPQLREIKGAAKRAAELTEGLLTFSRRVESKLRPIDLNHELERISKMLERTIPKMIQIELDLGQDLRAVKADPGQLQQLAMNLAVNARDAMPDGGKLGIETRNIFLGEEYRSSYLGTEPGHYVLLAVSDNGSGMNKDVVEHIFDPFFTTKEAGKGTGLGLSIAYGIVKGHGGTITCYSEPGEGTVFKIYLPAIEQREESEEEDPSSRLSGGTETILLVDDDDVVRTVGESILKRFGYSVLIASDGREGLEIFRREKDRISLIILDLIMPEMGGRECLNEILRIDPVARVLIASGYAADGQIDNALEEGARASISKPYELSQLLETVRSVLDEEAT